MSSFGDGNRKTLIERELDYIALNHYTSDFYEDKQAQRDFLLDVLEVLRFMCGE